jgi:hypothetical protein
MIEIKNFFMGIPYMSSLNFLTSFQCGGIEDSVAIATADQ